MAVVWTGLAAERISLAAGGAKGEAVASSAVGAAGVVAAVSAAGAVLTVLLVWAFLAARRWKSRALSLDHANSLLIAQQAMMEKTLVQVRSERHEFLKHLRAIEHLSQEEGGADVERYVRELTGDTRRIHAPLQGEKGHMASLLAYVAEEGEAHGIDVRLELDVPLSALPIGLIEQTKLAGNLLDNALEAAKRCLLAGNAVPRHAHSEAVIGISTSRRSGLYVLEVRNSTLPLPGDMLDSLFQRPVASTKQAGNASRRGIGTYVVADTVRRHRGHLDFVYESGMMTIKVKLPVLAEEAELPGK
ncbi:sensor histidine kinase [Paenibacillus puerhi]|uniref:sensor histidine kinase n=1 Tax=Paenibacillus puerhi TaxID=2692622 RepID=UPI00135A61B8|nr:GHKL domain-containing protein [Paenibacillus puerhi]